MEQIEDVAREEDFQVQLLSEKVQAHVTIRHSYSASVGFSWLGRAYTFNIKNWKSEGINRLANLFHSCGERDELEYGR